MSKKATINCTQHVFEVEALISTCQEELAMMKDEIDAMFSGAQKIKERLSPQLFSQVDEYEKTIRSTLKRVEKFNYEKRKQNLSNLEYGHGMMLVREFEKEQEGLRKLLREVVQFKHIELTMFKNLILNEIKSPQIEIKTEKADGFPVEIQHDAALKEMYQYLRQKKENLHLTALELVALTKKEWQSLKEDTIQTQASFMSVPDQSEAFVVEKLLEPMEKKIDETVRRRTVEAVLYIIEKKGFVVDYQQIKRNPLTNQVVVIGQKVSGEIAEFFIDVKGSFTYHFDGYEGQACQEDLQPFLEDLQQIYGVEIHKETTIQENPDKISSEKKQFINVKKGRE